MDNIIARAQDLWAKKAKEIAESNSKDHETLVNWFRDKAVSLFGQALDTAPLSGQDWRVESKNICFSFQQVQFEEWNTRKGILIALCADKEALPIISQVIADLPEGYEFANRRKNTCVFIKNTSSGKLTKLFYAELDFVIELKLEEESQNQ